MGFILFILSILLGVIIIPIGLIYGFIRCFWKLHFDTGLRNLDTKFRILATSLDIYGNAVCQELFQLALVTKDSIHPFGIPGETVSEVLAANYIASTLTGFGRLVCRVLLLLKDSAFK